MKIVMVVGQFRPVVGGAEIFTERLAKIFSKNHEVTIITGKQHRHSKKEAPLIEKFPNLTIERLNPWAFGRLKIYLLMLAMFFRIKGLLKTYDVVYVHQALQYAFVATLVGRICKKKVIVVVASRGEGFDLKKLSQQFWWGKYAAKYIAKHAALVASSQDMIEQDFKTWSDTIHQSAIISRATLTKEETIQNKNTYRQNHQLSESDFIFICVSRLSFLKNHSTLIEAFAQILNNYPNTRLIFLGDGEARPSLEKQILDLGIKSKIELKGNVQNVDEFLYASDAFILASDYEGESNALLEAMSAGLPCIISEGVNNGSIVHNKNGLIFPTKNVQALSKEMQFLIENPDDAKRLGLEAKDHIKKHHDLEKIAEQYIQLFQSTK